MGETQYEDLVEAGGLEAVLQAACRGCEVTTGDARGAFGGVKATVRQGDRAVHVTPAVAERLFHVRHQMREMYLSWVTTTELREVVESTAAWLGGATARELAADWPFADFVAVADAYESGDRIELAWQKFRASERHGLLEFVEAAMREPRLRRMFPFTSLWWMSFRPTADEYRVPGPWVRSAGGGRFTVVVDRRGEPEVTHDPAEAVRICLAEMDRLGVPSPEQLRARGSG